MVKVEVWGLVRQTPDRKRLWSGELPAVPREGEQLEVIEGWGCVQVRHVIWSLTDGSVEIGVQINAGDNWPDAPAGGSKAEPR